LRARLHSLELRPSASAQLLFPDGAVFYDSERIVRHPYQARYPPNQAGTPEIRRSDDHTLIAAQEAAEYGTSTEKHETHEAEAGASASGSGAGKTGRPELPAATSSQESYGHAIDEFIGWYCSEPRLAFNRTVVLRYRFFLEQKNLAPSTINVRLAAIRRLAYEASDTGLLSPDLAAGIRRVKGAKRLGVRIGNWLSVEQAKGLLHGLTLDTARGKRDRAILALLIGCGLRRAELVGLRTKDFQVREDHWVIADLVGKGKHIRTVPVPSWAKRCVDEWTAVAGVSDGPIFRRVNRLGKIWGDGITPKAIWHIVKAAAAGAGIQNLAPHDLRRTCARLCHLAGGELEQIQFLLGHASVQTTERYLGCKQKLRHAVNDTIQLEGA